VEFLQVSSIVNATMPKMITRSVEKHPNLRWLKPKHFLFVDPIIAMKHRIVAMAYVGQLHFIV
jgi:hypothetical protein